MRVLFVTDSLGAPRKKPEECRFQDTWCYKVTTFLGDIEPIYHNVNGLDTDRLLSDTMNKLPLYDPDIVVIQTGIVDCAPRALKKNEMRFVSGLGVIGKIIHRVIKKHYAKITKFRDICYVSPEKFESNLEKVMEQFGGIPVFAVAIGKPCEQFIQKSPLIMDRWATYNSILKKLFGERLIDPFESLDEDNLRDIYMSDLHHLNKRGQKLVADVVSTRLSRHLGIEQPSLRTLNR